MHHSFWRAIAATVSLAPALVTLTHPLDGHADPNAPKLHASIGQERVDKASGLSHEVATRRLQEADRQAREDAEKRATQQREIADLVAQEMAADAAKTSAAWSGYGVWWAALGSVATIFAAVFAAFAWRNSTKALKIATQGQRAHLLLSETLGGNCFGASPWEKPPMFCYKIVNHGKSPAWITGLHQKVMIGTLPEAPPTVDFAPIRMITLAPGEVSPYFTDPMALPTNFTWNDALFVALSIQYRDIYDERRASFLFKLILHGGPKNQDIFIPWGSADWWDYT